MFVQLSLDYDIVVFKHESSQSQGNNRSRKMSRQPWLGLKGSEKILHTVSVCISGARIETDLSIGGSLNKNPSLFNS